MKSPIPSAYRPKTISVTSSNPALVRVGVGVIRSRQIVTVLKIGTTFMAVSGTTSSGSAPRTRSGPELLVELDRAGAVPLHRQLADGLRDAIRAGRLTPHAKMPSTRVLAADLGVSRRLVVDA